MMHLVTRLAALLVALAASGQDAGVPEEPEEDALRSTVGTDVRSYLQLMKPRPLGIAREVALPRCKTGIQCWWPAIKKASRGLEEEEDGEGEDGIPRSSSSRASPPGLAVLVFDGRGVKRMGPNRAEVRVDGFVDLRKRTWVRFDCGELGPEHCAGVDGPEVMLRPDSPLLVLCDVPTHFNTHGGFGNPGDACTLMDLERRTSLLMWADRFQKIGPGRRVAMVTYWRTPPAWCVPGGDGEEAVLPQMFTMRGPEHAMYLLLDTESWPPKLLKAPRLTTYSDENGQEEAGGCARVPW